MNVCHASVRDMDTLTGKAAPLLSVTKTLRCQCGLTRSCCSCWICCTAALHISVMLASSSCSFCSHPWLCCQTLTLSLTPVSRRNLTPHTRSSLLAAPLGSKAKDSLTPTNNFARTHVENCTHHGHLRAARSRLRSLSLRLSSQLI